MLSVRISTGRRVSCLCVAKCLMLLLLLAAWPADASSATSIVTMRGQDSAGPSIVLVVPAPAHQASIGIARQVATIPINRGRLTIVETAAVPPGDQLDEFLAEAMPQGEPPDWVWVHEGNVREGKVTAPTIRLRAAEAENQLGRIAGEALGAEVTVAHDAADVQPRPASRGVMTFQYPPGTPSSRQIRYTRQLVIGLLQAGGSIAQDAEFDWDRLRVCAPRLLALYDAEGIGGNGPAKLERIAAERLDGAGIYRVCGEDIRDGALGPAAGTIFPGGSGRGIGDGLQPEGREILRDFITSGGGYLGVCAGAYFAGSGVGNYLHAIRLRHSQPWARGRAMLDIELTPEGKTLFGDENPVMRTRYANGPIYPAANQPDGGDPNFVVLARFKTPSTDGRGIVRDEMVGEAAIGAVEYGRGRLLIISPHPESHAEHYDFVARAMAWTLKPSADSEPEPGNSCGS